MRNRTSAIFMALILALAGVANAQVSNTGTISVVVSDPDGGRLPGVTVTAAAPDTITKRTTVTDAEGVAVLEALAPSAQYNVTVELTGFRNQERQKILVRSGQTVVAQRHPAAWRRHRGGDRLRDHAGRRRDQRDHGPGHHAAIDRVVADRPQLPELSAAGARRDARRPGVERQPRGALGSELQRHWRHRRHFGRQRLLLRWHQRHRPGHGNVRREPQHRDHPGTARHHRRHSSRVRRRARPDLERRHQVGQQHLPRLGQLLLPEQRPDGRERERRGRGVLDQGQRLHVWRPD